VDDNSANRRILMDVLTNWRMRPVAVGDAGSALEVLEKARTAGEPFALVLVDGQMPGTDGFTLVEQIKGREGLVGATIMMLTSGGKPEDAARCRNLGVAAYLVKPIKQADLLNVMVRALGVSSRHLHAPSPVIQSPRAEPCGPLRVLLVEDNIVNQRLAMRILEKQGHTVAVAGDGQEALELLQHESFHLAFMDIQMPGMDGLEATRQIREQEKQTGSRLPIVALTAHAMKDDRERCLKAGMDAYLSKPIQPEELLKTIAELLSRAAPVPTPAASTTP